MNPPSPDSPSPEPDPAQPPPGPEPTFSKPISQLSSSRFTLDDTFSLPAFAIQRAELEAQAHERSRAKMFSALPMSENFTFSPSFYAPAGSVQKHTPVVSSPLSSSSLQPSPLRPPLGPGLDNGSPFGGAFNFDFMSSSPPAQQFVGSENERRSEGKKKVVKKNPLIHREGTDNGRETRRKLFLKKVREDSNEKAWERRGGDEEILRSLFVSDRKRALAKGLREATPYSEDEIPDDIDIEYNLNAPLEMHPSGGAEQHTFRQLTSQPLPKSLEEEMADELARREEEELAAYAEMMEVPHQTQARDFAEEMMEVQEQRRYNSDDDYGWDDDMDMEGYEMDMDESMMEVGDGIVMSQQSQQLDMSQQSLQPTHHTEDSMDMS